MRCKVDSRDNSSELLRVRALLYTVLQCCMAPRTSAAEISQHSSCWGMSGTATTPDCLTAVVALKANSDCWE